MTVGVKIGIIGYGLMGSSLAINLLNRNYTVYVFNRSNIKRAVPNNIIICDDINEIIARSDLLVVFLSDYEAIADVMSKVESLASKPVFQMATISPEQTYALSKRVHSLSGTYIECPVLGSRPEASAGNLLGMVGPRKNIDDVCMTVLQDMLGEMKIFDELGQASSVKLSMNFLIMSLTASFAVALSCILSKNINTDDFMHVLRRSALHAKTFDKKLKSMCEDSFSNPNFQTKHLKKDNMLFIQEIRNAHIDDSLCECMISILDRAIESGNAELDYSSIFRMFIADR